jgi:hypothetical protein
VDFGGRRLVVVSDACSSIICYILYSHSYTSYTVIYTLLRQVDFGGRRLVVVSDACSSIIFYIVYSHSYTLYTVIYTLLRQVDFGGRRLVVGSDACVVGAGGGHPAVSLFLRDRALFDRGDLVQVCWILEGLINWFN